ncbi:MAG: allophanate hydrolase [Marmoricola sp.]|jgi:biotin-dependent carboxylase-like uncharacterized protein|nr:allophanate hydrolase [Marmoricola sp.]
MRELEVVEAGALMTVQDLGRPGFAHLGVPRSGAVDTRSLTLANRLVGNDEDAAGLETTLTGVVLRFESATTIAVTGASCVVAVAGRDVAWGEPVSVPAGSMVRVGVASRGLRSYVAVAGGIDVPLVLGSRSTDVLSGLGPKPLRPGDRLPIGAVVGRPAGVDTPPAFRELSEIRLRLGPRDDWFDPASIARLDGATYVVGSSSNRIGIRLEGTPLDRRRDGELPSEGIVLGAVQVPPSGQPLIFLADHPTTGGYPVLGVVASADLPGCGQLRPGDAVTLRLVG